VNITYAVIITPQAQCQIDEIRNYILYNLKVPNRASKFTNILKTRIYSLGSFPKKIALVPDEPWHSRGIRKMVVQNLLVYFWVNDIEFTVFIISVVYARRNPTIHLMQILNL
jgi:toxin ParE1/3/4